MENTPASDADERFRAPASFGQERLWFIHQFEAARAAYNIPLAMRLHGRLEIDVLRRALNEVVARHEVLRTTLRRSDGQLCQVVAPPHASAIGVDVVDAADAEAAQRIASDDAETLFDLERGPLVRCRVVRIEQHDHVLLLTMHHVVSDGWSMGILLHELATVYEAFGRGEPSPLPPLSIQYSDFAAWQREWLSGAELERQLSYWRAQLAGAPPVLQLPTDRPAPPVQTFRGRTHTFSLPADVSDGVRALCRRQEATPFMVLLTAFAALLHRYSGQDDIVIGSPVAGRNRAEVEDLIGFFVNTVVLRCDLSGDPSFVGLLKRVRQTSLGALSHQDVPFEQLVEALRPDRDLSHTPLFQVMFAMQNLPGGELALSELQVEPFEGELFNAKFDLTLQMFETPEGFAGELEYNTDLFDGDTVERMATHFAALVSSAVRHPQRAVSKLTMLTDDERRVLVPAPAAPAAPVDLASPRPLAHELVAAQAAATPDADALVLGGERMTYRDLDARVNRLAHHLRAIGIGPEKRVAILLERGPDTVVALLAVLAAGGVAVPLDAGYPPARLELMLRDSGAETVIDEPFLADAAVAIDASPETPCNGVDIDPANLAYLIYTSGSTGTPKAVMVTHAGLPNLVDAHRRVLGLGPGHRVLQFASFSFDSAIAETFMALATGAALHFGDGHDTMPGSPLVALLRRDRITTVTLPPSVLGALRDDDLPDLTTLLVAAEPCAPDLPRRWAKGRAMFNLYGPTEATVWATWARLLHEDYDSTDRAVAAPPIGAAIPGVVAHVLDRHLDPVPIGVAGEVYLGGIGLARGYLDRPGITAARFVPDPFGAPGARLYRTGDIARRLPTGELHFLGRSDHQVKVRGIRVELGEIEAVLSGHPSVSTAVAVAKRDIVAYVAGASLRPDTPDELRDYLRARMPAFLVPAHIVVLDELPRTPNGKVDRARLPEPSRDATTGPAFVAPRTPIEDEVAGVWRDVLDVDTVGVRDKFFDIGGNSLQIVDVFDQLALRHPGVLTVADLFEYTTVEAIAIKLAGPTTTATQTTTNDVATFEL